MKRRIKKAGIAIVGGIVLLAGIAMIPYPGPGWVTVFLGLGILSTEFEWAGRILHFAKDKYDAWDTFPPAKMAIVSKNIPTLKDRTNLLAQLDSIGIILRTK